MNIIINAIDRMLVDQEQRHSDIIRAGEQIRRWREEDRAAGIEWEIDRTSRERGDSNVPASDK